MNEENKQELVPIGHSGNRTRYAVGSAIMNVSGADAGSPAESYRDSSVLVDDFDDDIQLQPLEIGGVRYDYLPYGGDDQLPWDVMNCLGKNMVTSQCQLFNVQACYGQGVRFIDRDTREDTQDPEIRKFCLRNSLHELYLEQATDMKYFFLTVTRIVLSRDHSRIVQVRHMETCFCRFARKGGNQRFDWILYGDWRKKSFSTFKVQPVPLLDFYDPLGDLMVRMGKEPDPATGVNRPAPKDGKDCEFAIVCHR